MKRPTKVTMLLAIVEYIVIHIMSIFSWALPTNQGCNATSDKWGYFVCIAYPHPPPIKLHLVRPSFNPFMKIHETTFMRVLHTMDPSWCDGDLNDDGPSFYNTLIYMWPQWHGSFIPKFRWKKNKVTILACWVKNNKASMNLGEWM